MLWKEKKKKQKKTKPCICHALEKMELMEPSFGQVVNTSNQTGDKNKAVRKLLRLYPDNKNRDWAQGRQKGGDEGKPLRIYWRKTIGNPVGAAATKCTIFVNYLNCGCYPLMRNTASLLSRQWSWQKAETWKSADTGLHTALAIEIKPHPKHSGRIPNSFRQQPAMQGPYQAPDGRSLDSSRGSNPKCSFQ